MLLLKPLEVVYSPNVNRLPVDRRRCKVECTLSRIRQSLSASVEAIRAIQPATLSRQDELAALFLGVPAAIGIRTIRGLVWHRLLANNYAL